MRFRGRDGWRSVGPLDSLLKRMAAALQDVYEAPDCVYGFVPHRSTFTAAQVHVGAPSALVVDLKDFFGQVKEQRVRNALQCVLDAKAVDVFVGCCLRSGALPLGFRTSPVISNIVFLRTDLEIEKLCAARSIKYTRWADDLVFSGASVDDVFLDELLLILGSQGWAPNEKKTRFMSTRRVVLGLNVAPSLQRPHVPRGIKKELRKQVYYLNKFGMAHFSRPGAWPLPRILGMIAYVKSVDPNLATLIEQQLHTLPKDPRLVAYINAVGGGKWQTVMLRRIGL
ncbi:reverse transcriptase family protein [Pseudarthrobacter sp. NPDC092424]|uniref:reverse transcriptase family protein n=1 Tax=Pseudarthrobacter sp. NPDC092424 TaxID=3364415 RepID=UPI003828761B